MRNKILSLGLAMLLLFGLTACNSRQQTALQRHNGTVVAGLPESFEVAPVESESISSAEASVVPAQPEDIEPISEASAPVSSEALPTVEESSAPAVTSTEEIPSAESSEETPAESSVSEPTRESEPFTAGDSASIESESEPEIESKPEPENESTATLEQEAHPCLGSFHFFQETEELLEWIEQSRFESRRERFVDAVLSNGGMPVPRAVDERVSIQWIEVKSGYKNCSFSFLLKGDEATENDSLYVDVKPDPCNGADLLTALKDNPGELKTGSYKGLDYVWRDSGPTEDAKVYALATAWFVRDGYLISISSVNRPSWSNDCFDYFEFESVLF